MHLLKNFVPLHVIALYNHSFRVLYSQTDSRVSVLALLFCKLLLEFIVALDKLYFKAQRFNISIPSHFGGFRNPGSQNLRSLITKKQKKISETCRIFSLLQRNITQHINKTILQFIYLTLQSDSQFIFVSI